MTAYAMRYNWTLLLVVTAAIGLGEGIAFGALALLALITVMSGQRPRFSAEQKMWCWLMLGWLTAGGCAVLLSGEGWHRPREIGRWLPLLLVPLFWWWQPSTSRVRKTKLLWIWVGVVTLSALFGIAQYVLNISPGEALSRVDSTTSTQGRVPGAFSRHVAGGFFYHRLKMAHVLLVGLGGVVGLWMSTRQRWHRVMLAGAGSAMTVCLLFTFARAAMLAVGLAALVLVALRPSMRKWVTGGVVAAGLGVVLLFSPAVRERLATVLGRQASDVRALIWGTASRVLEDYPLGVGLGNYSDVVSRYYELVAPAFRIRTYPHNIVLGVWAETGPLGLAAFLGAWAVWTAHCVARVRMRADDGLAWFGVFVSVSMLSVGLTHDVLYHNSVCFAFAWAVGLSMASDSGTEALR